MPAFVRKVVATGPHGWPSRARAQPRSHPKPRSRTSGFAGQQPWSIDDARCTCCRAHRARTVTRPFWRARRAVWTGTDISQGDYALAASGRALNGPYGLGSRIPARTARMPMASDSKQSAEDDLCGCFDLNPLTARRDHFSAVVAQHRFEQTRILVDHADADHSLRRPRVSQRALFLCAMRPANAPCARRTPEPRRPPQRSTREDVSRGDVR